MAEWGLAGVRAARTVSPNGSNSASERLGRSDGADARAPRSRCVGGGQPLRQCVAVEVELCLVLVAVGDGDVLVAEDDAETVYLLGL